eukprot:510015-Pelagomonas_calceolata.AAC.1
MMEIRRPHITLLASGPPKNGPQLHPGAIFHSQILCGLKITQCGAVGGQEWRLGGQKAGFTPRLIGQVPPNPE